MHPFNHIAHASVTDVGKKRKNNEDAYAAFPEHGFFCVADGMGGAEDGEVASGAVAEGLGRLFARFDPARPLALAAKAAWVDATLNEVSNWTFRRSQDKGNSGTGTTFVGVAFDPAAPSSALALHAGDSRVYHWCVGSPHLTQVTVDHSVANAVGVADERRLNPAFRNMLMRAVGLAPSVQVERTPFQVAAGDWVIVCSDGLSKMVTAEGMMTVLAAAKNPDAAARGLVRAALDAGGRDNVTVVAIRMGPALPAPFPEAGLNTEMPAAPASDGTDTPTPYTPGTGSTEHTPVTPAMSDYEPGRAPVRLWVWLWCVGLLLAVLIFSAVARWLSGSLTGAPGGASVVPPPPETESPEEARLREMREMAERNVREEASEEKR